MKDALMKYETIDAKQIDDLMARVEVRPPADWDDRRPSDGDKPSGGAAFDSISICLSKGLGAPVGSILLGSEAFIAHAKRIRKRIGGGWRQAGFLAGAALYAIEHNVDRLAEDHAAARDMAAFLKSLPYIDKVISPETNVLIFGLNKDLNQDQFIAGLAEKGIGISQMGPGKCRMVFHLDITEAHINKVKSVLKTF